MKSINLSSLSSSSAPASGKKKPVFKSTLQPHNAAAVQPAAISTAAKSSSSGEDDPSGMVRNGWADDAYRPRFPLGCENEDCGMCQPGKLDFGGLKA